MSKKKKRKRPAPSPVTRAASAPKRPPLSPRQRREREALAARRRRVALIVTAIVLLVATVATVITLLIINIQKQKRINYLSDNLGKYVSVSPEVYRNIKYTSTLDPVGERDVDVAISRLLAQNKGAAENGGAFMRWLTLSVGDTVELYYRGYTLEGGVRSYFDGGCNLYAMLEERTQAEKEKDYIELGSGTLLFEEELLGYKTVDYATLEASDLGTVLDGDILYITYSVINPEGNDQTNVPTHVSLVDGSAEALFGEGFNDFILGKPVGKLLPDSFVSAGEGGDRVFYDITVHGRFSLTEGEVLTVETYFPEDYQAEDMRGVIAYFEIFVMGGIEYSVPEYNDEFITDTLGVSAADLRYYLGDTLAERYRAYLLDTLQEERAARLNALVEEKIWEELFRGASIKRLPRFEVDAVYTEMLLNLEAEYAYYESSGIYSSIGDYVIQTYGLPAGTDFRDYIREEAELSVKERLIFYTVARQEGLLPEGEEFERVRDEIYNDTLERYLESANCYPDKYETEEKYLEARAAFEKQMKAFYDENYGEDYFTVEGHYRYVMNMLCELVDVTETK
ncbi:MAG: hypothetical protein IKA64_07225 [Clostridia bacterium]|nr:hypothetical protein [Clostridia bacterium]